MTAGAGASAPDPTVTTGPPQTDQQLAEQALARLEQARVALADAEDHVDFTREHVAGMVAGSEAAVEQARENLAAAVRDANAAAARVENGGQS